MRYISVCSGIEAATVAWQPLGWEAVAFAEIEPFPCAVLAHHYPDVPNVGDITKVDWRKYANSVDLVVGGTPCQSFSVAGKREGMEGASGLVREYFRLLDEVRPRWFVWENVPGALSSNGGKDFQFILRKWDDCGYHVAWRILDAQYFGVAQRRRRVFAVGHIADWRCPAKVLFEWDSLSGNPAPRREARKGNPGSAQERAYTAGSHGGYKSGVGTLRASGGDLGGGSETLINCYSNMGYGDFKHDSVSATLRKCGPELHEGSEVLVASGYRMTTFGEYVDDDSASTLKQRDYKDATDLVTTAFKVRQGKDGGEKGYIGCEEAAFTLSCNQDQQIWHGAVRRLTPVECERLQGFPDCWTDIPFKGKPAPDGARYKALGNSMCVNVMQWIGERIQMVEDGEL